MNFYFIKAWILILNFTSFFVVWEKREAFPELHFSHPFWERRKSKTFPLFVPGLIFIGRQLRLGCPSFLSSLSLAHNFQRQHLKTFAPHAPKFIGLLFSSLSSFCSSHTRFKKSINVHRAKLEIDIKSAHKLDVSYSTPLDI